MNRILQRFNSVTPCQRAFGSSSKFFTRYDYMHEELQMHSVKRKDVLSTGELFGGGEIKWTHGDPNESASFCRQDPATGLWVIYAPVTTAGKPYTHKIPDQTNATHNRKSHDENCPFCPGNEHMCPPHLFEDCSYDGSWDIRVLPNKYSFLMQNNVDIECGFWGEHYPQVTAAGIQEVVVSSRYHNTCPAKMSTHEFMTGLKVLYDRGLKAAMDPRVRFVALFENHGIRSGGSIEHPHFQVVGLPIIPTSVLQRFEHAHRFHEAYGDCVFCNMLKSEAVDLEGDGTRIIAQNEHFACFVPYAASRSFSMWVVPKRHSSSFFAVNPEEMEALAQITQQGLKALYGALGDPDYNMIIRQAPPNLLEMKEKMGIDPLHLPEGELSELLGRWMDATQMKSAWFQRSYHWHLELIPHVTTWGGVSCFDVVVHKLLPETQADILRQALVREQEKDREEENAKEQAFDKFIKSYKTHFTPNVKK